MNRTELVRVISHQTGLTERAVDDVIESMIRVLGQMFSVGEDVNVRRLGKWRVSERDFDWLKNPHTGERMTNLIDRPVVVFSVSACLKRAARGDFSGLRQRPIQIDVTTEQAHRRMYNRKGPDGRLMLSAKALSRDLEIAESAAQDLINRMCSEGRLRIIAPRGRGARVFEVTDPDRYREGDTGTYAEHNAAKPAWG